MKETVTISPMSQRRTFRATAPGRAGIIGNPSDIYGGNVLSCSVMARATCRLTFGEGSQPPDDTRLWDAALKRFPLPEPVRVDWSTEVPRSSGLSGSTALLASTLACILEALGQSPDLATAEGLVAYAELVRDIERNDAGIVCGFQDAYMIVHGGLRLMNFAGKHPVERGPTATLESVEAPLPFLLITTGVERLSGSVHGPMAQRWLEGERQVVKAIETITTLAAPGAKALRTGNYAELGRLMDENHRLIAGLGGSGEPIDNLIADCKQSGAVSAKLAGAGLGGTVIALTEDPDGLESKLREIGYSRFLRPGKRPGVTIETD
jgi:galactokinase/mevalonate kinase-like predicted kinase